jgi:hypothetical protein
MLRCRCTACSAPPCSALQAAISLVLRFRADPGWAFIYCGGGACGVLVGVGVAVGVGGRLGAGVRVAVSVGVGVAWRVGVEVRVGVGVTMLTHPVSDPCRSKPVAVPAPLLCGLFVTLTCKQFIAFGPGSGTAIEVGVVNPPVVAPIWLPLRRMVALLSASRSKSRGS